MSRRSDVRNATLARRLGAMLYDGLLVLALLFLATLPFVAARGGEPVASDDNFLYRVVIVLVVYLFFAGFWSGAGRTLGMQSWGLRIETADGGKPGLGAATIRFAAACLSLAVFGLGFLWSLWDPDRLAWHDRLSGTRLVYYPKNGNSADPVQGEHRHDQ